MCCVDVTQIGALPDGRGVQVVGAIAGRQGQRIEERVVDHSEAELSQARR